MAKSSIANRIRLEALVQKQRDKVEKMELKLEDEARILKALERDLGDAEKEDS